MLLGLNSCYRSGSTLRSTSRATSVRDDSPTGAPCTAAAASEGTDSSGVCTWAMTHGGVCTSPGTGSAHGVCAIAQMPSTDDRKTAAHSFLKLFIGFFLEV